MVEFEAGKMLHDRIEVKIFESIEHGRLDKVSSVVLHRTAASSAKSTLNAYSGGQKSGAHFLIGKDGKIYQTARADRVCWHVGILLPRCEVEKTCDSQELKTITALLHEDGLSFSHRVKKLSRHEVKKITH